MWIKTGHWSFPAPPLVYKLLPQCRLRPVPGAAVKMPPFSSSLLHTTELGAPYLTGRWCIWLPLSGRECAPNIQWGRN